VYVLFCVFGLGAGGCEKGEIARLVQFTAVEDVLGVKIALAGGIV
jgi:hypothetical protein